jgi:type 1 fimbria pilin
MEMRSARRTIMLWLLAFVALVATPAYANNLSCNAAGLNNTIAAGSISIPAGAATGSTVLTLAPSTIQNNCFLTTGETTTSGTIIVNMATVTAPAAGFTDVYPTNINGLGIRYTVNSDAICDTANQTMTNKAISVSCLINGVPGGAHIYANVILTPSLVVTGPTQGGLTTLSSSPIVTFTYTIKNVGGSWPASPVYTGAASGTLATATCSVQTVANSVTLPTVTTRSFGSGVGAVEGSQTFTLGFVCATGAQVSIVITDAVTPSNRSTTLTLKPESTATGIGIQLLRDAKTPVAFGPDAYGPGVANQWLIGVSPNGILQVPLTAQYIRTGTVGAGTVKALATFTMSYQ